MVENQGEDMIKGNNDNEIIIVQPNTIRSEGAKQLNLLQQRILFYSMLKVQKNKTTSTFSKREIEDRFNVDFGSSEKIKKVINPLVTFNTTLDLNNNGDFVVIPAFQRLEYKQGVFTFKFNQDFLPQLNNQKKFLQYAMESIGKFKCKYTVYLYDFLKENMFRDITVISDIGLKDFKKVFKYVDKEKINPDGTISKPRNSNFKARCWQPAMEEINKYTDYKIEITTRGRGDALTFTIHRFQNEDLSKKPKNKEPQKEFTCGLSKNLVDYNCKKCLRINQCPFQILDTAWNFIPPDFWFTLEGYRFFMNHTFWDNQYYDITERMKLGLASQLERDYFDLIVLKYEEEHPGDEISDNIDKRTLMKLKQSFNSDKLKYKNAVMSICIAENYSKYKAELALLATNERFDIEQWYAKYADQVTGGQ